jgi:hypothetical protein
MLTGRWYLDKTNDELLTIVMNESQLITFNLQLLT